MEHPYRALLMEGSHLNDAPEEVMALLFEFHLWEIISSLVLCNNRVAKHHFISLICLFFIVFLHISPMHLEQGSAPRFVLRWRWALLRPSAAFSSDTRRVCLFLLWKDGLPVRPRGAGQPCHASGGAAGTALANMAHLGVFGCLCTQASHGVRGSAPFEQILGEVGFHQGRKE